MDRPKVDWSENVILIDAAFLDTLTMDFCQHFQQVIHRPLGKLNLCHWLDCLLLDAGIREGNHDNFVAFLHPLHEKEMKAVSPGNFKEELNEKAFQDRLGEFTLSSYPVEQITSRGEFLSEALKAAMESEKTQQILVVGEWPVYGNQICEAAKGKTKAQITLFGMESLPAGNYQQQVLGYSVMSGLGIFADELK